MSSVLYSNVEETFEFEWLDPDNSFSGAITAVNVRFIRYSGITVEYLQSNGTSFGTTSNSFVASAHDSPANRRWRVARTIPASMVGFNITVEATPTVTTGDLPVLIDDFFVFNANDDLTISTYSRDGIEAQRSFSSGFGYVRGTNFSVQGTKSIGAGGFTVTYDGSTYAAGGGQLVDNGTTWTFTAPAGNETTNVGRVFTLSKSGSLSKTVTIVVDRTAPTVSLAHSGMTVGTAAGTPMIRGEYARWVPTYSDGISGVDTGSFSYGTASNWVSAAPAITASGVATGYQRTSSTAPVSGSTDVILTVTDKAGNSASTTLPIHFTAVPTAPTISGAVTSTNQAPLTLFTGTELTESPTAYTNTSVTATTTVSAAMPVCRNSATDNTTHVLASGTLTITNTSTAGAAATTRSITANVSSNTSGLGLTITPTYQTQYYQTGSGTAFGSFDYNANKATDINTEPTLVTPSGGLNAVAAETLYDRYVPTTNTQRGLVSSQANISIVGGQAITTSTTTNNQFVVRIPLTGNNATNQSYRISCRGSAGALSAADVDVAYAPNSGTTFTAASLGVTFTSTAGAASMDVRVTMKSTATNSRVNAIYVEYVQ